MRLSPSICAERANNSFKPNLLRYGKGMAEKACHTFAFTTQVGLTQALGRTARYEATRRQGLGQFLSVDSERARLGKLRP